MNENLIYKEELPTTDEFWGLFLTTGWNDKYKLTGDELFQSISKCWYAVSVYDENKLIGFGRIVSDGLLHAMIYEMIVEPDYQGKGIGERILLMLIEKCKQHNIRDIQLFCAKGKREFYEKYGFVARPDDAPGMQYKIPT